jgi:plastocyanin
MQIQPIFKARRPIGAALGLAMLLVSQSARAEDAGASAAQVEIDNFAFKPEALTVKAGTKVTFVNRDDIPHSVVSGDSLFRSPALDTDESFAFTFTTPGEFGYFCGLHPHMIGKVVVTP